MTRTYPACVWLNPVPEKEWDFTYSIQMVRQLMGGRMYPLTLEGLGSGDAGVGAVSDIPILSTSCLSYEFDLTRTSWL